MRDRFASYRFLILAGAAVIYAGLSGDTTQRDGSNSFGNGYPILDEAAYRHILDGDSRTGGGHRFGTGKACKSEFPKGWSDLQIQDTVLQIAANDNLDWQQQGNGYFTAETLIDGINVRVVLAQDKRHIVTAYPTNTPRNPCPAAANDNRRP